MFPDSENSDVRQKLGSRSALSVSHSSKNKDDISSNKRDHVKEDFYNNYSNSRRGITSDNKDVIFPTGGNRTLGYGVLGNHPSAQKERGSLSSLGKQDSVHAGKKGVSGMGSGTNGLSKFESRGNLIDEAREDIHNDETGSFQSPDLNTLIPESQRVWRVKGKPSEDDTEASTSNTVLSNQRREPTSSRKLITMVHPVYSLVADFCFAIGFSNNGNSNTHYRSIDHQAYWVLFYTKRLR